MSFKEGHKKLGGRKQGSSNRLNSELRARIQNLIEDSWETVADDLKDLSPKARLEIIVKMMDFVLPKMNRISIERGPQVDDLLEMTDKERSHRIKELTSKLGTNDR